MVNPGLSITLKGSPKTTGRLYATVCRGRFPTRYLVPEAKALKEDYQWQAKKQYKGEPLKGELSVGIRIYSKTKRKCDWDNFHKLSMDALTGIVYEDDSQITEAYVVKDYDKENPRIEINIKQLLK
jgi:Holliday junction resolvase RusA-like endonuclease